MPLLHHDESDGRTVSLFHLSAGGPDGDKLLCQDGEELEDVYKIEVNNKPQLKTDLALAHSVTEHDQFLRFPSVVRIVELHQQILGDVLHVDYDLLVVVQPPVLHPHLHLVLDSTGFHAGYYGCDTRLNKK